MALFLNLTGFSQITGIKRSFVVSNLAIRVSDDSDATILPFLQNKFAEYDPEQPFEYQYMNDIIGSLYVSERRQTIIIGLFAGICIFISCLGLFGLSAFNTARRAKEMSIRKVLGASPLNILLLLFNNTFGLIAASSLVSTIVSYLLLNSWLNSFAYRESLLANWLIFVSSALVALLIAFITVALQSYKTVCSNAAESLRME